MIVNRAFFGKDNCLKITLNHEKDCYFHWGLMDKSSDKYKWIKVKFSDLELADMIRVLSCKKSNVSFFHKFNSNTRQIWINKNEKFAFFKVKELSKSINMSEIIVIKILLQNIIWKMNSDDKK